MKKIKIRTTFQIESEDDQWHELKLDELTAKMNIVSHNKLLVIENAYTIEKRLESIITFYFFGRHEINKERAVIFDGQILKSNWCSFDSKRKLLSFILDDLSVFENIKEKEEFEKIVKKVMSYRNAFTHGQLTYIGERVKLTWFEGTTRKEILTDDYLTKIESDFLTCFGVLDNVSIKIGETNLTNSLKEPLGPGQGFKIPIDTKKNEG